MPEQNSNYTILMDKLDVFIRKFYTNQLIRGALYWIAVSLAIFLLYSVLEHNFYFSKGVRKFFFFSYLAVAGAGLFYWIVRPASHIFKLGTRISHDQAARIIGEHFVDVRDKLLNILQLRRQVQSSSAPELVFASIEQKTEAIKLVPFKNAIDFSQNKKYLKYALPPMLVLLVLLVAAPSVIRESTSRIIHNNEDFQRAAPFQFFIDDAQQLSVVQYEDFALQVRADGNTLPHEVFIEVDGYQYRMKKESAANFSYRFKNVHKDLPFKVFAGRVSSDPLMLHVLKKPNLISFSVQLDYPGYTGQKDETLQNIGDLVIPAGTQVTWDFHTLNTEDAVLKFNTEERVPANRKGEDLFSIRRRFTTDLSYLLFLSNDQMPQHDSVQYAIHVIPDLYPTISVQSYTDSVDTHLVYFAGSAGDDYGFTDLSFNHQISNESGNALPVESLPMGIQQSTQFPFSFKYDISELNLQPGDELTYYFEVRDNDAVSGPKTTRSSVMKYRKPTVEEFAAQEEENNQNIKESLESSLKEAQRIQEELKKLREQLLQENQVEWQNKKEIEKLMERQKKLQEKMKNSGSLLNQKLQNQQELSQPSEELRKKQQTLQELFDKLANEEQEALMEKLNEMMDQLEKKDALEMLEDFEMSEEELEKELDRLMELFKQLEVEQEMQRQIEKLEKLAEEQEKLSEKTEQTEKENKQEENNDALEEKQEEIKEEFEKFEKDMKELGKKNEELERPKNLDGSEEQMKKIEQDMENSKEQLEQKQNEKSAKSQKNAAQRMRDMAQQMSSQMKQGQMDQMQEDMETLRQLLENLVTLSFDQEDLIDQLSITQTTTPRYVSLTQDQFKLKNDFKVVEDTLQALSKRVMQIESFITEKVTEVKSNLNASLEQLEERQKPQAADHQQRTMKNLNDLALMLSEVMNQMQQQMSSMMPGSQMCNNPGGQGKGKSGRVPMDKITEGQQGLNEDMKKMMQGRKEGGQGSSEEFARMAARQAAMRKALRDFQQEKQQRGQGDPSLDPILEDMDKVETQLVNKQLSNEMLKRQQEILTRLLEAERAEREREMDNERRAEMARQTERTLPPAMEEYIKKREAEIESYRTASPVLRPYYKFLVEEYYNALKNQ
jgi:hypothetical protein